MVIGKTSSTISPTEIFSKFSEVQVLCKAFPQITSIPCKISSPFRVDNNPSFSIFMGDDKHIYYKDFGDSKEKGSLLDLLCKYWDCSIVQCFNKICSLMSDELVQDGCPILKPKQIKVLTRKDKADSTKIQVTVRPWRDYDYEYWRSYGVEPQWLKYMNIKPISHKIITKKDLKTGKIQKYIFPADKYAYVFWEKKDGNLSLKIYMPFNTKGFKWCSCMDKSVWSLWTKIPPKGDNLIIGSSVKDCMNISCNLHIPAICMQGEGYEPKPQIIEELKSRYQNIIVFYDNDFSNDENPGRTDSIKLSKQYGLKRVEIPAEYKAKDPSDLFKKYGKEKYMEIMSNILKPVLWKNNGGL